MSGVPVVKVFMFGDSGVGKSCLMLRYAEDTFESSFLSTVGIDFKVKSITVDGKPVKLQIWDTAGQERYRSITAGCYRGAHGVVLVYSVLDQASFDNVRNWMKYIDRETDSVKRILIANKADVEETARVVSREKGQALAAEYGVGFYECSAKSKINVTEAFEDLAKQCVGSVKASGEVVNLDSKEDTKCC